MPLHHRRTLIHYSLFPKHMRPMFFGTLLYNIADQMIGFFLPLFLFGIGSKLAVFSWLHVAPFVSGILFVVMYYALQRKGQREAMRIQLVCPFCFRNSICRHVLCTAACRRALYPFPTREAYVSIRICVEHGDWDAFFVRQLCWILSRQD